MSWTTTDPRGRASISAARARTRGWMMTCSRARRFVSSANTRARRAGRSESSRRQHLRTERGDDLGQSVGPRRDLLAGQQVGVDHDGAAGSANIWRRCSCLRPGHRSGHAHVSSSHPPGQGRWQGCDAVDRCRGLLRSPAPAGYLLDLGDVAARAAGCFRSPLDPRLTHRRRADPRGTPPGPGRRGRRPCWRPWRAPRMRGLRVPARARTSGTTDPRPKGVASGLLPSGRRRGSVARGAACGDSRASRREPRARPAAPPLGPLRFAMGTLLAGGPIVVPGPFDPAAVTRRDRRERPTTMFCVPAHLQRLFAHWDESGSRTCPRSAWWRTRERRARGRRDRSSFPGRVDVGGSTAPPRDSSRPAAARSG